MKQGFVYIMSNKSNKSVYIGVTNNLKRRVWEHKNDIGSEFVKKYKCHYLVYYELVDSIDVAIAREKHLKAGSRSKKDKLIIDFNPKRIDLYIDI